MHHSDAVTTQSAKYDRDCYNNLCMLVFPFQNTRPGAGSADQIFYNGFKSNNCHCTKIAISISCQQLIKSIELFE